MRVFAGPNGSGKTTIFKGMLHDKAVSLGIYVNADEIEADWIKNGSVCFDAFDLEVSEEQVQHFFQIQRFCPCQAQPTRALEIAKS